MLPRDCRRAVRVYDLLTGAFDGNRERFTTVEIRNYYHLYLDGDAAWSDIAAEFAHVLKVTGFPAPPAVGIVGADREPAKRWLDKNIGGWTLAAEADTGYEQVTLSALQRDLPAMRGDTAVLYTHAKGAWRNMPLEDQWRRSMLWYLVFGWENCTSLLRDYQTAGCHWRENHYSGNFWWARADYLRLLPPVTGAGEAERGRAETWIGLGNPSVANLAAGFPPDGTEDGARLASERLPARHIRRRAARTADDAGKARNGPGGIGIESGLEPPPRADRGFTGSTVVRIF